MARRACTMPHRREIWPHGHAGDRRRALARHVGVDRQTLRTYLQGAEAAGDRPHQPGVTPADGVALDRPQVPAGPERPRTAPALLVPYHDRIVAGLTPNTVTPEWRRLVDATGVPVSLRTFRRYCSTLTETPRAEAVTGWRPDPPPGQEVPGDFGLMGWWTDPRTPRRQRIGAFRRGWTVSRPPGVWLTPTPDLVSGCQAPGAAFAFFGAVPHRVARDNLKDGGSRPTVRTRRGTRAMLSSPLTTGSWSTPAAWRTPRTSRGSNARCVFGGTVSGLAARGRRSTR
jgi:hypothetical protein